MPCTDSLRAPAAWGWQPGSGSPRAGLHPGSDTSEPQFPICASKIKRKTLPHGLLPEHSVVRKEIGRERRPGSRLAGTESTDREV